MPLFSTLWAPFVFHTRKERIAIEFIIARYLNPPMVTYILEQLTGLLLSVFISAFSPGGSLFYSLFRKLGSFG